MDDGGTKRDRREENMDVMVVATVAAGVVAVAAVACKASTCMYTSKAVALALVLPPLRPPLRNLTTV